MKRLAGFTASLLGSLALTTLLLLPAPATATPLCLTGGLDTFVSLGSGGCQIEDKVFSSFAYSGAGSGGAVAIPASGVNVVVLDTAFDPGLKFTAAWSVGPGQTLDSLIEFIVTVLPGGHAIKDISAEMAGFGHAGGGLVTVAETTSVGNLFLFDSSFGTVASASSTFAPTIGPISVSKDIAVNGNQGVAAVSSVSNQFSEVPVPEPSSLLLLGSSLFGLAGMGYFRPKKK